MNNLVLKKFTYETYRARPELLEKNRVNYRIERVNGGLLCDLWFLTTGCKHDAQGGCVMCNYGKRSANITPDSERFILDGLEKMVREFPWTFEDFLLTSSGSMLDTREVSLGMWDKLLPILNAVHTKRFIVETRAETVTDNSLRILNQVKAGEEKYVEIGLESSNDWVLQHCLNKASTFAEFCRAVRCAHACGVLVTANIGLGIPFMNERTAIQEAIRSIQDALDAGADSIVVFPYHVKSGTLVDVMYRNGLYQCVSLWALVEVLNHFPKEHSRLQISWYKDYFSSEQSFIYASPQTCLNCATGVMKELDRYRSCPDKSSIDRLYNYPCTCHDIWRTKLADQPIGIDLAYMEQSYRLLASVFSVDEELLEQETFRMKQEFRGVAE